VHRWEGPATLEWWANQSTCFGRFHTWVIARVTRSDWACEAVLDPQLSEDSCAEFDRLMALGPPWTLRFGQEDTLLVEVTAVDGVGLVLRTWEESSVDPCSFPGGGTSND
jgi:hypothetical protein